MISRKRLLAGLAELEYVEEAMVTLFANFTKALVQETEGLEEEKRKEIERKLNQLYRDSLEHKKIIDDLLEKVEKSPKNEY